MSENTNHGPLFDVFSRRASSAHGGSVYDTAFGAAALEEAHGRLFDLFGAPRDPDPAHGARFDEFGWRDMPVQHGRFFDEEFRDPASGVNDPHGTWFDVFRGGNTQARVLVNGKPVEGVIVDVNRDFATLRDHAGQDHEVELGQFLGYRTPAAQQAAPRVPGSDADAPSARNRAARGGHGEPGRASVDMPQRVGAVPRGDSGREARSTPDASLEQTFLSLKQAADDLDVSKARGQNPPCDGCGVRPATHTVHYSATENGYIAHRDVCHSCGKALADRLRPLNAYVSLEKSPRPWVPDSRKTADGALDVEKAAQEPFGPQHRVLPENVSGLAVGTPVQIKHNGAYGAGVVTKKNSRPGFHEVDVHQSWKPGVGFGALPRGRQDIPHGAFTHAQTSGWQRADKTAGGGLDVEKAAGTGDMFPPDKFTTARAASLAGGAHIAATTPGGNEYHHTIKLMGDNNGTTQHVYHVGGKGVATFAHQSKSVYHSPDGSPGVSVAFAKHPGMWPTKDNVDHVPYKSAGDAHLAVQHHIDTLHYTGELGKSLDADLDVAKEYLGWDKMVAHLQSKGHSKESAEAIAGYIAKKKYGPGMNRGHAKKSVQDALDVLKSLDAPIENPDGYVCSECGGRRLGSPFEPGLGVAKHVTCQDCGQVGWLDGTGKGHDLAPAFHAVGKSVSGDLDVAKDAFPGQNRETVGHITNHRTTEGGNPYTVFHQPGLQRAAGVSSHYYEVPSKGVSPFAARKTAGVIHRMGPTGGAALLRGSSETYHPTAEAAHAEMEKHIDSIFQQRRRPTVGKTVTDPNPIEKALAALDVEKGAHGFTGHGTLGTCQKCGHPLPDHRPDANGKLPACTNCGAVHTRKPNGDGWDVSKSVDTTETAAQRQESGVTVQTVGHRANCPRGGSARCGADVDGHCALCGAEVHDHEAVGKSREEIGEAYADPPVDPVTYRDHKTSDHNMTLGALPKRCPHCGKVLEMLDDQTEQGAPSRKEKQGASAEFGTVTAHKCVGAGLDVLKSLVSN